MTVHLLCERCEKRDLFWYVARKIAKFVFWGGVVALLAACRR